MKEFNKLKLKKIIRDDCEIYVAADQLTSLICEINEIIIPTPREVMLLKEQGFEIEIKQS